VSERDSRVASSAALIVVWWVRRRRRWSDKGVVANRGRPNWGVKARAAPTFVWLPSTNHVAGKLLIK
jgi:hypothetical protein